jgi:hypothetical protein
MSKQLPWFRVYTRMVDDDKLKLLAFEDRWHFVALLCLKGEGLLDKGDAPGLLMRKVAVKLGLDVRSLEEVARRLAEVGLVDQATLQPVKWDGLQMRSDTDTTAAERKKRQRAREKAAKAAPSNDVTGDSVPDTDASRVTGTDVTRTDTDTIGATWWRPRCTASNGLLNWAARTRWLWHIHVWWNVWPQADLCNNVAHH